MGLGCRVCCLQISVCLNFGWGGGDLRLALNKKTKGTLSYKAPTGPGRHVGEVRPRSGHAEQVAESQTGEV